MTDTPSFKTGDIVRLKSGVPDPMPKMAVREGQYGGYIAVSWFNGGEEIVSYFKPDWLELDARAAS